MQSDVKSFSLDLGEDISADKLVLNFSHVFDPGYTNVPVAIAITFPGGTTETVMTNLELRTKSGKDLGSCTGDICDLKQIIKKASHLSQALIKLLYSMASAGLTCRMC